MELQLRQLSGSARWHHSGCPRTQSSIIVSDNGKEWVLCNASPDISQQIAHTPELNKAGVLRGTHIGGIILTDSQIDHTTGLLSLREGCPHQVWCTPEVHEDLSTGFPVFTMLRHWNGGLVHHPIAPQQPFTVDACPDLQFTAGAYRQQRAALFAVSRPAAAGS